MYKTSRHLSCCTRNPWIHVWNKSSPLLLHQESLDTCIKQVVTSPTALGILGHMYETSRHLSYCIANPWIHVCNKSSALLLHQESLDTCIKQVVTSPAAPGILGDMYETSRHLSYCTRNPWIHVWNKSPPFLLHQESLDTCIKQVATSPAAPGILGYMYVTSRHLSCCTRNPWIHVCNKSSPLLLYTPGILGYMYETSRHLSYFIHQESLDTCMKQDVNSPTASGILGYMYETSRHLSYCTRNPWTHVWNKSSPLLLHQESLVTCMKQVVTSPIAPGILGYMYETSRHLSCCTRNPWIHV